MASILNLANEKVARGGCSPFQAASRRCRGQVEQYVRRVLIERQLAVQPHARVADERALAAPQVQTLRAFPAAATRPKHVTF